MSVASGILKKEEIPQDIFQYIDERIKSYKKFYPNNVVLAKSYGRKILGGEKND